MFRLFIIYGFINFMHVCACDDLPNLCIEKNEGKYLQANHNFYEKCDRITLLPKTETQLQRVYKECWKDGYFCSDSVCEIEGELRARIKDKNLEHVQNYINVMWKSMYLFKNHPDKEFAFSFFYDFFSNIYLTILSLEREFEQNSKAFNRNDLIYVVKSISDMQDEFLGYDEEPGSFFNLYKQLHLTGEYWQSEEGQNMINAVTGALSEGFSLK